MNQLTQFETIKEQNEIIKQERDFSHVLEKIKSRPFQKRDIDFYFKTITEISDRINLSKSLMKTFVMAMGEFSNQETLEVMGREAQERLDSKIHEIILLLSEIANGREAEFSKLDKRFRRNRKAS